MRTTYGSAGFTLPDKPIENAYVESINGHFRNECLNSQKFESLQDARSRIEACRIDHNVHRPHSFLGQ